MAGSSSGFGSSDQDDEISGINITPLVDVVLVLLVIFLMTAPVIYQSAIKVQLPKAQSGEATPQKNKFDFTLTKEGQLLLDSKPLNWNDLDMQLAKMSNNLAEETALISADQTTEHGTVVRLMDALRKNGISKFALNVDSDKNSK